jgi:outer membrane protein OmpA-like peptidoglycan-associated protein/tetratricopeptide (TPR) repeat protein
MKPNIKLRFVLAFSLVMIILSLPILSHGQWYDPDKVTKKAKRIYESAYDLAMKGEYTASISQINEAIKAEPKYVEAYLSRASVYAELKEYNNSIADFEKAILLDSVFSESYYLPYSISLAATGAFEKALLFINKFLSIPNLNQQSNRAGNFRKDQFEFAVNFAKAYSDTSYHFSPKHLGSGINTENHEYFPSLTIDGKKMIFTRRVDNDEDFYVSELKDGEWGRAIPVRGKLNTNLNEGAQTVSQDGRWLIFTGCNYPEGMGSCDLYISYLNRDGEWTEAENMGRTINSDQWESTPSLSPDKKDLYFSSNRAGGFGGKDIWVSHLLSNGKWSAPENLGPVINTKQDETCPFIHADNNTLYFNSEGHDGYGMSDIFFTVKKDEKHWATPLNLGFPINTIDDEGSLSVSSDGKTAYYASDKGNLKNKIDIYSFQLRKEVCAQKTLWVTGKVTDSISGSGLPCSVTLEDLSTQTQKASVQTDEDGTFLITLPEGKDYSLEVNRKGYLFYSDHFSISQNPTDSFFSLAVKLQPIVAGAGVVLKNLFFDTKSAVIRPESEAELNTLVKLLQDNPALIIEISGHTDNIGKKEDNLLLSQNRAKSVATYLILKGIDSKRLLSKGYGDTMPLSENETEKGKSLNRRTEIHVISNKP